MDWQGEQVDGLSYCRQVKEDRQAGRPPFPRGFLGDSPCIEETVSPACLGLGPLEKDIRPSHPKNSIDSVGIGRP